MICVEPWHLVLFLGGFLLLAIGGHVIGLTYWLGIWYAIDVTLNAILAGNKRETMSSRLGKMHRNGSKFAAAVCWCLSLIDKGHCEGAIDSDVGRGVPVAMAVVGIIWVLVLALAWFA